MSGNRFCKPKVARQVGSEDRLDAGQVGARSWGAALSIDDLVLHPDGATPVAIRDDGLATPERRAREDDRATVLRVT